MKIQFNNVCKFFDFRYKDSILDTEYLSIKKFLCDFYSETIFTKEDQEIHDNTAQEEIIESTKMIKQEDIESANQRKIDFLKRLKIKRTYRPESQSRELTLSDEIEKYFFTSFEFTLEACPVKFWHNKKSEYSILFGLSETFLSIPPTQVCVERTFSTLGFILCNLRTRLNPVVLQKILTVKLNEYILEDKN